MSLMPVSEALAKLLCAVEPLETEFVSLENANGRYLSEPLVSTRTQPPFAASAMDGYAIRHDDLTADGTTLTIIGEAPAGHGYSGTVGAGETVRIFTGAPVPPDADTIVIQENVDAENENE